jgi:RNA polymerase subunit RPABC4/transcription elongation factor Spt4
MIDLLSLALRLEGEGQYNLAKLARAAVDSLGRQAAYQQTLQAERQELVSELNRVIAALSSLEVNAGLLNALQRGAEALSEGRLPLIHETPHPYVCRTCGHIVLGEVTEKCPTCGARPETFQWFAPIYWLDAFEPHVALEKLRQTPLEVAARLHGLPEQALNQPAQDGGWAIRNLLAHLRDAQGLLDFRLDLFARAEHPLLESKAVFTWATREEEKPPTGLEIFETYKEGRAKILAQLDALPYQDWLRTGNHAEFGSVSIRQQVSYFACHELTHLPQLERLRVQLQKY